LTDEAQPILAPLAGILQLKQVVDDLGLAKYIPLILLGLGVALATVGGTMLILQRIQAQKVPKAKAETLPAGTSPEQSV
jgi:hypothetical protein